MLLSLEIKNLAVVASVTLNFERGLSAITGETGAGKSILVDALGLLSGIRADAGLIRSGADRAEVVAEFAATEEALAWLREAALDEDQSCLIKRVIRREGASKAFINGRAVSASQLTALTQLLFEIHGQNEHQSLLIRQAQLRSIDELGALEANLGALGQLCQRARAIDTQLSALGGEDAAEMQDFLRFQIDELSALDPLPGALDELNLVLKRLSAVDTLRAAAARHLESLNGGEHALLRDLGRMQQDLARFGEIEPAFRELPELIAQARVNLDEAATTLRHYLSAAEADPQAQRRVEERLDRWHELARKHRVTASELPDRLTQLQQRLAEISANLDLIGTLKTERAQLQSDYLLQADALSAARTDTAARLSSRVEALLAELRMAQAKFIVSLERDHSRLFDPLGQDRAEFLVNFNLSQELKPLRKVASGGELSRMSLCLRLAAIESISVPTVIFDEIDAGVGGIVADSVGRLMKQLGGSAQVLAVTHLAQVAACADHHLVVSKAAKGGQTLSALQAVEGEARVAEIARMLGGERLSGTAHAQAMLGAQQGQGPGKRKEKAR
jgi:DNA repair protein RecN (Recombination protein N)